MILFLSTNGVIALHGTVSYKAVNRVVDGRWSHQGKEMDLFKHNCV